jgi:hypothetical protein
LKDAVKIIIKDILKMINLHKVNSQKNRYAETDKRNNRIPEAKGNAKP